MRPEFEVLSFSNSYCREDRPSSMIISIEKSIDSVGNLKFALWVTSVKVSIEFHCRQDVLFRVFSQLISVK